VESGYRGRAPIAVICFTSWVLVQKFNFIAGPRDLVTTRFIRLVRHQGPRVQRTASYSSDLLRDSPHGYFCTKVALAFTGCTDRDLSIIKLT
jgi:hypothetical protein